MAMASTQEHHRLNAMPSSYDSSTSSVEIIGATSPPSARGLAADAASMDSSATVAARTLPGPVAEQHASSLREQRAVDDLCRKHGVPKDYTARPAGGRLACTRPPEGAVCVYADALEAGMRVPLPGFVSETLSYFGLAPSQLTPNGWRILLGFVVLCHNAGVPPSLAVFRHFFSLRTNPKLTGWYYFQPSRPRAATKALFISQSKNHKGWKDRFFFLTSPEPWQCPVRWGDPPSKSLLDDPVLTKEQMKSVAKLRGVHVSAVDLRAYLCETNLAAAFTSNLARESLLPQPPFARSTSTAAKGLRTDQSEKKAMSLTSGKEKVKTEPGRDASAVSGKKRNREEANSNDGACHSELSSLPADHICSATCLCVPPGFEPKPAHLPVQDASDVGSAGLEAARESMLQTVNFASSYALELEKKLAEHVATKAELEKKLVARDEEVAALRGQLKQGRSGLGNVEVAAAVQQVVDLLLRDDQVRSQAEHALEGYKHWKVTNAARRA